MRASWRAFFLHSRTLVAALASTLAAAASASVIHVDFVYGGDGVTWPRAAGYADFDSSQLPNPGGYFQVPVERLRMKISGSAEDDGWYDEHDFPRLWWDTAGATLDFSQELVGQPTPDGGYWGRSGDFSLDGVLPAYAHFGIYLRGANPDPFISLSSASVTVIPEPASFPLVGLSLLAMAGAGLTGPRRKI